MTLVTVGFPLLNAWMMEELVAAVVGGLAGFLTSLFFWRKSQRKHRPRLYIRMSELDENNGDATFKVVNEGDTHALNIEFDDSPALDAPDLGPGAEFSLETIDAEESKEYMLSYVDVWGTKYTEKWFLHGAQKFDLDGTTLYYYAHAEKGYEFQGGGITLKLRGLFKRSR